MLPCLLHYSEAATNFPEADADLSLALDPVLLHPRGEDTHPLQKMMAGLHVDNLEWIIRKSNNLEKKMQSGTSMVLLELKNLKQLEVTKVTQAIRNRHIYAIHMYTHVCYIHIYIYVPYIHVHRDVNNQNLIINSIVCVDCVSLLFA